MDTEVCSPGPGSARHLVKRHLWVGYLASEAHAGLWIARLWCSQAFFSGLGFSILFPIWWMVSAGSGRGLSAFLCRQVSRAQSKKSWQKPNESENNSKTTKLLRQYFSKMWTKCIYMLSHLQKERPFTVLNPYKPPNPLKFSLKTIFKVFTEFVTVLLLFYVLVYWPQGKWDISSLTRDQTLTLCIGRWSLNHWITREVPALINLICE